MDTAQWEEFGFWNGGGEAGTHAYHPNMEDQEHKGRVKENIKPTLERIATSNVEPGSSGEAEPQFSATHPTLYENHSTAQYDSEMHTTLGDNYPYRNFEGQSEQGWNYADGVWQNSSQWYNQGQSITYGGIELDTLMFQILDMIHQVAYNI